MNAVECAVSYMRTMLDDFNHRTRSLTTPLLCCCYGLARGFLLCTLHALSAHLSGIPAVVSQHLKALVCNVLRDCRDEITRAEHLKAVLLSKADVSCGRAAYSSGATTGGSMMTKARSRAVSAAITCSKLSVMPIE